MMAFLFSAFVTFASGQPFPCGAFKFPLPYAATTTRGSAFGNHVGGAVSVAFTNNTHVYNVFVSAFNASLPLPNATLVAVRGSENQFGAQFLWSPSGGSLFWANYSGGMRTQLYVSNTATFAAPSLISHANPITGSSFFATFVMPEQGSVLSHSSRVLFTANPLEPCVAHLYSAQYTAPVGSIIQLSPVFSSVCSGATYSFSTVVVAQNTAIVLDSTNTTPRLYRSDVTTGNGAYLSTPAAPGTISALILTSTDV